VKLLIDQYPEGLSTRNQEGELPFHVCVYAASEFTDNEEEMEVLRLVSERHPAVHKDVDKNGNSLLHIACNYTKPNLSVVSFLAAQNEAAVSTTNAEGCLPLHLAVQGVPSYDSIAVVKFLVEAFPESLQTQNARGNLPLHVAVNPIPDHIILPAELVEYLLNQFPVAASQVNANGSLPLHLVCSNNRVPYDYIDLLVKYYPVGLSEFDGDGLLPFHRACLRDQDGTFVQKMLQTWFRGRDLPLTEDNVNALFFACENNASLGIIKLLAEKSLPIFRTFASNAKLSKK